MNLVLRVDREFIHTEWRLWAVQTPDSWMAWSLCSEQIQEERSESPEYLFLCRLHLSHSMAIGTSHPGFESWVKDLSLTVLTSQSTSQFWKTFM